LHLSVVDQESKTIYDVSVPTTDPAFLGKELGAIVQQLTGVEP
jgi:hypothetical protein